MSDKQELIAKLLEMQKKFIDYEHEKNLVKQTLNID